MGNVALNKNATASSFVAPFTAAKALDGSLVPLSRWLCDALPAWMSVDLGELFWIDRWVVRHMGAAISPSPVWPSPAYNIKNYKLQGSMDNSNWFDIDSVANNTQSITDRNTSPVQVRWVKLAVTSGLNINPGVVSVEALEVYESQADPYLSGLRVSVGTLSPAFNRKIFNYTVQASSDTGSIIITPTAEAASAAIKINTQVVASGQPSQPINLVLGDNNIVVTVSNGPVTQIYTVKVNRQGTAAVYLSNLELNWDEGAIPMTPPFAKQTYRYTADAEGVNNVTVTPYAETAGSVIKVNNVVVASGQPSTSISLHSGSNTISIEVTPESGGSATTYTLTVSA